jgi:hypothetical protein
VRGTGGARLHTKTNPYKPIGVKFRLFSYLLQERAKQTHEAFPLYFEWISSKKPPFFAKNEWIRASGQ